MNTVQGDYAPGFIGLDMSLTGTGQCVSRGDTTTVTQFGEAGKRTDTLSMRIGRLERALRLAVLPIMPGDRVAIESPTPGSMGHQHDRSGLYWMIVNWCWENGNPITEIAPTQLKLYALGKGVGTKEDVLVEVVRRYAHIDVRTNNMADALVLTAMLRRHHGVPLEDSLPKPHLRALEKVVWAQ